MWRVEFSDAFDPEFDWLDQAVQDELLAQLKVLERQGSEARFYKMLIRKADKRFAAHLAKLDPKRS